jgi:hypothetical protein
MRLPGWLSVCLIVLVFRAAGLEAQTAVPGLRHLGWQLLDIVILPDWSFGVWLLVAPNPRAVQWMQPGNSVISMNLDPIVALQWATVARSLKSPGASPSSRNVIPALRDRKGPQFLLLAKNPKKAAENEAVIFLVSDSTIRQQWKTFASQAQLDTLLTALEALAREQQGTSHPDSMAGWRSEDSVDIPVQVVFQPRPEFPEKLAATGREGRVWMSYVVDSTGLSQTGTLRALLSDDPLFTQAAMNAVLQAKFRPAIRQGRPVRQRVFQTIVFRQR